MDLNFDEVIDRRGSNCVKWEFVGNGYDMAFTDHADPKYGPDRVLPLWVADMDFPSPPAVIEAVTAVAQKGFYGYSSPCDSYYGAVVNWMARRHNFQINEEWIEHTPGVVPAVHMLVQTFVPPGEKVLLQRPVYYPFFDAIVKNNCEIVSNSLLYEDGRYRMDFDDLAQKAANPAVKMAILCNPHNPVGRVWTKEELARYGEICLANDVLVVSDEIFADLTYPGVTYTPFATVDNAFARKSIVCTAASKAFNLAGMKTSNIIIPSEEMRAQFVSTLDRHGLRMSNPFGIAAVEAAYTHGEPWLHDVMDYVEANYLFMKDYLAQHLPQVTITPPEGTYLIWVDFRSLGLDPAERKLLMMDQARVYLDEGELFGPEGEGFERFNIACPRSILEEALERIRKALESLKMPVPG